MKRGTILAENIIFIMLNLVFLTILFLFLFSKTGDASVFEEKYAKQIALIIDSAKPGMEISLNMKNAVEKAKDENWNGKLVTIQDNIVTVQLREKGGYSYSFFNNIDFERLYCYPDDKGNCVLKLTKYKSSNIENE